MQLQKQSEVKGMELVRIPSEEEFLAKVRESGDALQEAARMLVLRLDNVPDARQSLLDRGFDVTALRQMERLGRGQIIPQIAASASCGARALGRCPVSEQRTVWENGVEVLEPDLHDTRRIEVVELSRKQCQQVFGRDGLRSIAQQRTWLEEEARKKAVAVKPSDKEPWVYRRDHVEVGGVKLFKHQLLMFLEHIH